MDKIPSFMGQQLGKSLIILGALLIIVGIVLVYKDRLPFLKFLGHLPGDVAIEKENFRFYFPIMTSILLSLFLSFILWLFRR